MILLDQFCNQSRPSSLVAGADAGTVVAVEVFVKQDQVAPVRIVLEFFRAAENRSSLIRIAQEDARQPREISPATSHSVIILPEPVGNSTLKLSPR